MESMPTRRSMLASAASLALLQQLPMAAHAEVRGANSALVNAGEKEVNKFLTNNGFPAMKVPGGLSPLALYIGLAPPANIDGSKTKERYFKSTLLVRFLYPSGWLVETPSITENGEAGKIAANNYLKGDAADFVSLPKPKGKGLADLDKASPTNESNTFLTYGGNGVRHMGKRGCVGELKKKEHESNKRVEHTSRTHKPHTQVSHTSLTHTLLTHKSHTQVAHTSLTHTLLTHTLLTHKSHTQVSHTSLTHKPPTQVSHTSLARVIPLPMCTTLIDSHASQTPILQLPIPKPRTLFPAPYFPHVSTCIPLDCMHRFIDFDSTRRSSTRR